MGSEKRVPTPFPVECLLRQILIVTVGISTVGLFGCPVTTYRPVYVERVAGDVSQQRHGTLYFSVTKSHRRTLVDEFNLSSEPWEFRSLKKVFSKYSGFEKVLVSPDPVTQGVFVMVRDVYDYAASDGHG